jgi:hypothetical protein
VTRNHGGPEEGGWYFDAGYPLASVPFAAEKKEGHAPRLCQQCDDHRANADMTNVDTAFCKEEVDANSENAGAALDHTFHEWLCYQNFSSEEGIPPS